MTKGAKGRRNSQKKKKNSKGNEEIDAENVDEGVKKCPHISRAVKLQNLQNKVPHTTLGQCVDCGELDSSEGLGVCICLCCARQGCDRNSEEKHALSHNKSKTSHSIVVHLQSWVVWCYACDDEVPVEQDSAVHNCIKLILKAMNLTPPPELEVSLSSPNNTPNEKPKKDDLKNNSEIRSRIKGLTNLGNTCFFNAVMQNLCQTELLHVAASCAVQESFSQHLSPKNKDAPPLAITVQDGPGPVTKALWKLLQDFRSSSGSTLNPKQLFGEICKKATRFRGYRQQDSQELLRYLLDSIEIEEIKRVKRAILKSFGVCSEDDSKVLDDNKRAQVKEYGACVEAPLIDSVFAGRFVSIVICRQCQQEFKVEETFLDLSLPLTAPQQESWNFKPFTGGKQNPKSPRSPKNSAESENIKSGGAESEADNKVKNPSKHQQKAARKADRKKGKKGKGHGKGRKGQTEAVDNKKSNKDDGVDDEEGEEKEPEREDDELDQMNVSDLDGSDNEQEHKLNEGGGIDKNSAAELPTDASDEGAEEMPDYDTCVEDEKSSLQQSPVNEQEHKLNEGVGIDKSSATELPTDASDKGSEELPDNDTCLEGEKSSLQQSRDNEHKLNEGVGIDKNSATELPTDACGKGSEEMIDSDACVEDESSLQQSREIEEDCNASNLETNNRECEEESLDAEKEVSLVGLSSSGSNEIISSKCNSDNFQRNTEDLTENEPSSSNYANQISSTVTSDSKANKEDQHSHAEPDVDKASGSDGSVLSSVNEISVEGIENLTLNAGLEKEDNDFPRETVSKHSSGDCTFESRGDDLSSLSCTENTLKDGDVVCEGREVETFAPTEGLPGGNSETASVKGKDSSTSCATDGSLNGTEGDAIESQANERDAEPVKNDQDFKQEIAVTENERHCSDSSLENETQEADNATIKSEEIPGGSETDSEDEHEPDSGTIKSLTLQPAYHPSPGECSVMSCLSQFCASEVLDGSNKFACEECSRRARRLNGSINTGKERNRDDGEDSSDDEDECKGAKAAKNKESKEQIVYTVATKQLLISLAPPVLTLHLKRFQQARFTLRKLTKHVDFPLELNLAPFCSRSGRTRPDSEGRVLYSLYGVVQHNGNMNSGHYTAYVKVSEPPVKGLYDRITNMKELTDFITNMWTGKTEAKQRNSRCHHEPASDGQWFHVSDSSVSSVPETGVLKSQAYMLFYGRLPLCSR